MTKEEAYNQATFIEIPKQPFGTRQDIIYAAMDIYAEEQNKELKDIVIQLQKDFVLKLEEHAKQECIDFYKWAFFESGYQITDDGIIDESGEAAVRHINYEELYELFLKAKKK